MCCVCAIQHGGHAWPWRLAKWLVWLKTEFQNVLNWISWNFHSHMWLVFAALAVLSLQCPLSYIFTSYLTPLPITPRGTAEVSFSSVCGEPAWIQVRAGKFWNWCLSWPPLLPFSRNLKAALRLLSCCGFSLRLQKLGDLSGMPTQEIVSPDCLNRKSCVGHWWWISSFRVAASWKHYQDHRLPKCFIRLKNILTTDFLHVWEGLLNSSFFMPYLWKWDKCSIAFIRIALRTPEGAWKRDSLRVEGIYFLKRSDTLYFSQPCTEDENKFCQVMD